MNPIILLLGAAWLASQRSTARAATTTTRPATTPPTRPATTTTTRPATTTTTEPNESTDRNFTPSVAQMTPTEVARQLRDYLTRTGRFGTAATPDNAVEIAQRALGVTADGIVGAGTRAAARKLGVTLPLRKAVAK